MFSCELRVILFDEETQKTYKGNFPKSHSEMLLDSTESGTYEEFLKLLSIDEHDQIYAPF